MKLCIDCKHCYNGNSGYFCTRGEHVNISLVTGEQTEIPNYKECKNERSVRRDSLDKVFKISNYCGTIGIYFEPKK